MMHMELKNVELDYFAPEDLKPFIRNPKRHPRSQIDRLKLSIGEFGFTQPILVNQHGMIVAGHARWQAAKELGLAEIPVITLELTPERSAAYAVADNKIAELGETDDKLVAEILQESKTAGINIEALGYAQSDMDKLLLDIQQHDNRYKPGVTSTAHEVEFIKDPDLALQVDKEAEDIFANKSTIICYYSGGKDSSFALIWAKTNYPDKRIIAVFSDTSYEYPGMVAHIYRVARHLSVEAAVVHPEIDIFSYWEERGRFFNMVFPECQSKLIFDPINKFVKQFDPKDVVLIDGSRGDQVRRLTRKTKTSKGMDKSMDIYDYYHPCHDIDLDLEKKVVEESGIPIWEGYSKGFQRSACWCCPGMNGKQAYALSVNYPGLTNAIRDMEKRLGMKLQSKDKGIDDLIRIGRTKAERKAIQESQCIADEGPDPEDRWINANENLSEDDLLIYNRETEKFN